MMIRTGLMLLCFVALQACGATQPIAVKDVGGEHIALYVNPAVAGERSEIYVTVRGAQKIGIAELSISMPEMGMPPQSLALTPKGDGRYDTTGTQFTMSGTWHVIILERASNALHPLTSFDIPIR